MKSLAEKSKKKLQWVEWLAPLNHLPMSNLRISPICLTTKNNGDFRLIHNLSQSAENSVNDFIDSKFCSMRYLSIDDWQRPTLKALSVY